MIAWFQLVWIAFAPGLVWLAIRRFLLLKPRKNSRPTPAAADVASERRTRIRVTAWRNGEEGLDAPVVRLRIDVDVAVCQLLMTPYTAKALAGHLIGASDYAELADPAAKEPTP